MFGYSGVTAPRFALLLRAKAPNCFAPYPLVKTNGKEKPTAKQDQSLALNLAGTSEFIREMESELISAK